MAVSRLLSLVALAAALSSSPRRAGAGALAMIVDETTGTPEAWWADGTPPAFDGHLRDASGGSSGWIDPERVRPSATVSRVLARPDISPANARSLAGLYGATLVVVGRVWITDRSTIGWLELERTELTLSCVWLDVATGAVVRELQQRVAAYGPSRLEDALRTIAARVVLASGAETPAVPPGPAPDQALILVRSPAGAPPFVAFKTALREVHPGIVGVDEVWATEGIVALSVALDEGVPFSEVAPAVVRLTRDPRPDVRVIAASFDPDGVVRVELAAGVPNAESRVP